VEAGIDLGREAWEKMSRKKRLEGVSTRALRQLLK
jgi:hypothetical protein